MVGAPNTQSQKYLVSVIQATPGTPVSEEIADIFRNYYIDGIVYRTARTGVEYWLISQGIIYI